MDLVALFDNTFFFLTFVVTIFGLIGLFSKSFVYAIYAAFITFATLAINTQYDFFISLLILVMTIILVVMSFQIYGMIGSENGGVEA